MIILWVFIPLCSLKLSHLFLCVTAAQLLQNLSASVLKSLAMFLTTICNGLQLCLICFLIQCFNSFLVEFAVLDVYFWRRGPVHKTNLRSLLIRRSEMLPSSRFTKNCHSLVVSRFARLTRLLHANAWVGWLLWVVKCFNINTRGNNF